MRCAECGARNKPRAEWCTQCYAPLGGDEVSGGPSSDAPEETPPPVVPDAPHSPGVDPAAPTRSAAPPGATGPVAAPLRDDDGAGFRQGEDGPEWSCQICGEWNDLDAADCVTCGAAFARAVVGQHGPAITPRDPSTVLIASVALPGAGHIALGRTGDGLVRAVTYVLWVGGALMLLRGAAPLLPVVPLIVGALALLVMTARDAVHLAEGGSGQVLTPRVFLWLVVGVVGTLIAGFLPGILQVVDSAG